MASQSLPRNGYLLGLDVGDSRIGAALASVIARLPQPAAVIPAGETSLEQIRDVIAKENVTMVVIGIPRNLEGSETAQSQKIRQFAGTLAASIDVPVVFADESLSSVRADELVRTNSFKNASQDSLAACFILEEYLNTVTSTVEGES
jgi:putative Holliday junction resolvase